MTILCFRYAASDAQTHLRLRRTTRDLIPSAIPSADDLHGITTYTIPFSSTATVYESAAKALPDSDAWGDDNEEMYHSVRFLVTSNGVTCPWTKWEDSAVVSFHL